MVHEDEVQLPNANGLSVDLVQTPWTLVRGLDFKPAWAHQERYRYQSHSPFDDTPVETECPSGSGYFRSRFNCAWLPCPIRPACAYDVSAPLTAHPSRFLRRTSRDRFSSLRCSNACSDRTCAVHLIESDTCNKQFFWKGKVTMT